MVNYFNLTMSVNSILKTVKQHLEKIYGNPVFQVLLT